MTPVGESGRPAPSSEPTVRSNAPKAVRRRWGLPIALAFFSVSWWVWCLFVQSDYGVVDSLATTVVQVGWPSLAEVAVVVALAMPLILCGAILVVCAGKPTRQRWCVVCLLPLSTSLMCSNVMHTKPCVLHVDGPLYAPPPPPGGVPPGAGEFIAFGLFVAMAIVAACTYWVSDVRRERVEQNKCRQCGYDLSGSVSGVCPECGDRFVSDDGHGAA